MGGAGAVCKMYAAIGLQVRCDSPRNTSLGWDQLWSWVQHIDHQTRQLHKPRKLHRQQRGGEGKWRRCECTPHHNHLCLHTFRDVRTVYDRICFNCRCVFVEPYADFHLSWRDAVISIRCWRSFRKWPRSPRMWSRSLRMRASRRLRSLRMWSRSLRMSVWNLFRAS